MKGDIIVAVVTGLGIAAGLWAILTGQFSQTWVTWVAVLVVFCLALLFCVAIGDMVRQLKSREGKV